MDDEEKVAEMQRENAVIDDLDQFFLPTIKPEMLEEHEDWCCEEQGL